MLDTTYAYSCSLMHAPCTRVLCMHQCTLHASKCLCSLATTRCETAACHTQIRNRTLDSLVETTDRRAQGLLISTSAVKVLLLHARVRTCSASSLLYGN